MLQGIGMNREPFYSMFRGVIVACNNDTPKHWCFYEVQSIFVTPNQILTYSTYDPLRKISKRNSVCGGIQAKTFFEHKEVREKKMPLPYSSNFQTLAGPTFYLGGEVYARILPHLDVRLTIP